MQCLGRIRALSRVVLRAAFPSRVSLSVSPATPSGSVSLLLVRLPFLICRAANSPAIADLKHGQFLRLRHEHYRPLRHSQVIRDICDCERLRLFCRHIASFTLVLLCVSDATTVVQRRTRAVHELHAGSLCAKRRGMTRGLHPAFSCTKNNAQQRRARAAHSCSRCSHTLGQLSGRASCSHSPREAPSHRRCVPLAQHVSSW